MLKEDSNVDSKMTRTNTKLISSPLDPVYAVGTNDPNYPLPTIDVGASFSSIGKFYTASTGAVNVANAAGFLVFELRNPQNSGKTLYISGVLGGGGVVTTISIFKNASISGVTPLTLVPQNTNFSFANSSVANPVRYFATPATTDPTTGGTLLFQMRQAANPASLQYSGQIIIPPSTTTNQYFYVRLLNSTTNSPLSISVSWWEN